ncbi:MAG TPA: M20/M25/M40 family metallo-hydrolase [Ktedonobacterales bacterium]|nr:M20/M25/M40 family metallo-hydrolase [Ktedonobacterales bacterium]
MATNLTQTLIDLAGIPSVSGQEGNVRAYLTTRLEQLGLSPTVDAAGNLIARVAARPGERDDEPPLLLNAHMDRVPPGLAHTPIIADGVMRSDGTTNLGADDSAGLAIILHTLEELQAREAPHPPLLILFTVGEEVGLVGAKAFDPTPWGVQEGLIFDNAGEAGLVVTRAATYIAVDVTIHGVGGHPGKGLMGTANAIEIFRRAAYPVGALDGDTTRISFGRIEGGAARNAIPRELRALGEVRTLREGAALQSLLDEIAQAFTDAATTMGGSAEVTFDTHCDSYVVDPGEPLLRAYAEMLQARGQTLRTATTFIGSDASALRQRMRVFTISTGAMDEHTSDEWIALAPLADLVENAVTLLGAYHVAR